jgi:hypothetical protein
VTAENIILGPKGVKEKLGLNEGSNRENVKVFDFEKGGNLSELLNLAQKAFHATELKDTIIFDPDASGLGIALEEGGDVIIVGLTEAKKEGQLTLKTGLTNEIDFNRNEKKSPDLAGAENIITQAISNPIIGHQLDDSQSSHLILSDAIDVVFYSGGHKHVENFELGKDLLWFFLPSEKISGVDSQVLNSYDMMLSFGDSGTLTLLDVISSSDPIDFI